MTQLEKVVELRRGINALCSAIDAGAIDVSAAAFEQEMVALATIASQYGLKDEVFMLGARTRNGKAVLGRMSQ